jgi:cytochrome c-type biogenesis protein CcmF
MGAVFETAWKIEAAEALQVGGALNIGAYHVSLDDVRPVAGPNYDADQASISVTRDGKPVCQVKPERRLYTAGGQTTSEVGICYRGPSHIYLVLGERRDAGARPAWLVRAYWNPWASLIFLGPVIMGLGGLVSLSDRRLRMAVGRRREPAT